MKGFGGLNMNMLKQAQKMQEKMAKIQEEVGNRTIEVTVGGGMVTVEANGKNEVISIKIAPEVVDPDDIEMLQDLVISAVNEALRKTSALMAEEMQKLTKGLGLPPGLF
jgi:DNA-binding YbaB/EbfC family protein